MIRTVIVAVLAAAAASATTAPAVAEPFEPIAQAREMCFSSGEKTSGLNKICFYNCPSGEASITIGATQLCPLSIKR